MSFSDQTETMKEYFPLELRGGVAGALSGSKSGMRNHSSLPGSMIKSWSLNHFARALNSPSCITRSPLHEATLQQRMPTSNRHIRAFISGFMSPANEGEGSWRPEKLIKTSIHM